jgi:ParB-like chromosome segregation protein Spo0J
MDAAGHRNGLGTDGRNRDRLHVLPAGVRHSEQQLAELAASVDASIEIHPPVLRDRSGRYEVVAGAGRVEVARRRGRMEIAARVIPSGPEFDGLAELVQIDENLVRVDPPPAERDKLIRRRKELWERRHPEAVGSGVLSAAGKKSAAKREGTCDAASQVPSFVSETARATGKSKRGVQRSLARTEKAGPEVATAYERSEVSPAQVDELAKLPKDKQEAVLAKIKGKTRDETRQAVREAQGQPHAASPPLPTPPVSSPRAVVREVVAALDAFNGPLNLVWRIQAEVATKVGLPERMRLRDRLVKAAETLEKVAAVLVPATKKPGPQKKPSASRRR